MALFNMYRICKIKTRLFGTKDRTDEICSELSEFRQHQRCMAETVMLIRAIAENFVGHMKESDAKKFYDNWCVLERMYEDFPWIRKEDKNITPKLQNDLTLIRTILADIERFIENPPIVNSNTDRPIQDTEPMDEVSMLRQKLRKLESDKVTHDEVYNLLRHKETTLTNMVQKVKAEVLQERQRADYLGTKLLEVKIELEVVKGDNMRLQEANKKFESSLTFVCLHHYFHTSCFGEECTNKSQKSGTNPKARES